MKKNDQNDKNISNIILKLCEFFNDQMYCLAKKKNVIVTYYIMLTIRRIIKLKKKKKLHIHCRIFQLIILASLEPKLGFLVNALVIELHNYLTI